MSAKYNVDPTRMSLATLERNIGSRELVPSRRVLKNDLKKAFGQLAAMGIHSLQELLDALKNKKKLEALAQESGLEPEYLVLLKREASSYLPKPVRLSTFPGIKRQTIAKLESEGITNTKHLFELAHTEAGQTKLSRKTGLSTKELAELVALSGLARLYGVGPAFARMLCDLGIDSVAAFVKLEPKEIIALYEKESQKKADFTESDIKFTLELARSLEWQ